MAEKYIAPVFTGVVEMFFGDFSELVGTNWHPFDGRVIKNAQGATVFTTVDPNGRYLQFYNSGRTANQHIPKPNNVLSLGGGAHNHGNSTNIEVVYSSNSHKHDSVYANYNNFGGRVTNTTKGGMGDNQSGSTGSNSSENASVAYTITAAAVNHNHNAVIKKDTETDGSHSHSNRTNDKFASDSDILRMPDFSIKLIVYVEGVVYNG